MTSSNTCLANLAAMLFVAALFMLPTVASGAYFYKYGVSEGDFMLVKGEDAAVMIALKAAPFRMYGKSFTQISLYDNGYIGVGKTTGAKTPSPLPFLGDCPMIAVYWADIDTTNQGTVFYRETQDSVLLDTARNEIRGVYGGSFAPTSLFIATWDSVGYCCSNNAHGPEVNSFQLVLATDGISSYAMFHYGEIQWTTGDKSGGSGGFGGSEAVVGINKGDRMSYVSVIGSGMPEVVDIETQTNIMKPGVFMYRTDKAEISPVPFSLYPFGTINSDTLLPSGDDANSGLISLATDAVFYSKSIDKLIVYENGYIGVGGTAGSSYPQSFPFSDSNSLAAPFWANIARSSTTGNVYYRETTDAALLSRAIYEIMLTYGGTVSISSLFIVTWDKVGYAPNGFDKLNTFQAVIATDSQAGQSYVLFLYDVIQWTKSAVIGINAGDDKSSFTLSQSGNNVELANLETSSNSGLPGEFILSSGNAAFYPFGPMFTDRTLGHVDDHSIFVYLRISPFPFYDKSGRNLRVYSNGYIAIGGSFGGYCPSSFPTTGTPLIAPFWADADVSSGVGGIYFRETAEPCVIDRFTNEIRSMTGDMNFVPLSLFIATWDGVGYNSMHTDKLNSFQAVLATDGQRSYILSLYKSLEWTTSDACGSQLPQAGISAGDSMTSTSLPSSGTPGILNLNQTSNAGVPGLHLLISSSGTPARVNSYSAQSGPNPLATKLTYMDPKLMHALELEAKQQSNDHQREVKLTSFNQNRPYIEAKNVGGRFRYNGK